MNPKTTSRSIAVTVGLAVWLAVSLSAYAFYNPSTGRWISRDPADEAGFLAMRASKQLEADHSISEPDTDEDLQDLDTHYDASFPLVPRLSGYASDARNIYLFVANAPIHTFDASGLCSIAGASTATDDAKRKCSASEILTVELRIDPQYFIGHAFLKTAHLTSGFFPYPYQPGLIEWWNNAIGQGRVHDDSRHPYSRKRTRTYSACPVTMFLLEWDIAIHSRDSYGLSNLRARNCAGWSLERLQDVGFSVPFPPNTYHLKPRDL